jgi:tetratricopeptide (TPR) repeat protein
LEEHIERLQQQVQQAPEARSFQLLAAMHRIRGDMSAALEAAEQAGDEPLQRTILLDLQRWNELAELHDDETVRQSVSTYRKVEHLALAAAYYRRAGDKQAFEEALHELRALSDNASLHWHVAESLLLNGQLDEGIELMWKASEEAAFRILCAQTRFEEAFAAAGIEDLNEQLQPWIEALLEDARARDSARRQRFDLGVHVARALAHIGWRDEARRLFEQLAEVAGQDEDGHQRRRRGQDGERRYDACAHRQCHAFSTVATSPKMPWGRTRRKRIRKRNAKASLY